MQTSIIIPDNGSEYEVYQKTNRPMITAKFFLQLILSICQARLDCVNLQSLKKGANRINPTNLHNKKLVIKLHHHFAPRCHLLSNRQSQVITGFDSHRIQTRIITYT